MTICMCIDGLCATLSMTLSSKTALASRWYVFLSSLMQLVSLVLMVSAAFLRVDTSLSSECCTTISWWGNISSCHGPSTSTICYLVVRLTTWAHGTWLAVQQTAEFDLAKKEHDKSMFASSYDYRSRYEKLPATVFSVYCNFLASALVACLGLEKLLENLDTGHISDWGQSAALITAIAGISHWVYVLYHEFPCLRKGYKLLGAPPNQVPSKLFDKIKIPLMDYPRLEGGIPDLVDKEGLPRLQRELLSAVENSIYFRFKEILNAIELRQKRGEHASLDWVDDSRKETALIIAVDRGNQDFVQELLDRKASAEVQGTEPAIATAMRFGHFKLLDLLLDHRSFSAESIVTTLELVDDYYADHVVVINAVTRLLHALKAQAMTMHKDNRHRLMRLVSNKYRPKLCELLLTSDIFTQSSYTGSGPTFLDLAISNVVLSHSTLIQLFEKTPHWFVSDERKLLVLVAALQKRRFETVRTILDLELASTSIDDDHLAEARESASDVSGLLIWGIATGKAQVVGKLLSMGVPIDCTTTRACGHRARSTMTALQMAASLGYSEIVKMLLRMGFKVNEPAMSPTGRTALQAAAENGYYDLVERLLTDGADIHGLPSPVSGLTALQAAASSGSIDIVQRLLELGSMVNEAPSGSEGSAALHAAAGGGHLDTAALLISEGADLEGISPGQRAETAINIAAERQNLDMVKLLLQAGAELRHETATKLGLRASSSRSLDTTVQELRAAARAGDNLKLDSMLRDKRLLTVSRHSYDHVNIRNEARAHFGNKYGDTFHYYSETFRTERPRGYQKLAQSQQQQQHAELRNRRPFREEQGSLSG